MLNDGAAKHVSIRIIAGAEKERREKKRGKRKKSRKKKEGVKPLLAAEAATGGCEGEEKEQGGGRHAAVRLACLVLVWSASWNGQRVVVVASLPSWGLLGLACLLATAWSPPPCTLEQSANMSITTIQEFDTGILEDGTVKSDSAILSI